jgi:hypothetical protein
MNDQPAKTEKNGAYYFVLNLLAPGIAQFALKHYFRGFAQLSLAVVFFLWTAWEILRPLIVSVSNFLAHNSETAQIQQIGYMYFVRIFIPLFLICVVWGWSMLDLFFLLRNKKM